MSSRLALTLDSVIFGLQRFGGISSYWAQLVEHARARPAWSCRLVLPRHLSYREFDAGWVRDLEVIREVPPNRVARYLRATGGRREDVFHTSYYRVPSRRVRKYVVTAYDFTYERYRSGLARSVHSAQKRLSIDRADAVICISEATRRDVLEYCPGTDTARVHVVHLGVDRAVFFPEPASSPSVGQQVLFVGQRGGYKRFDLAVETLRQMPELSLGIVGPPLDDDERARLRQTLGDRWHEYGPIGTQALRRLYSSAFAFVFPSDYEGFGLPVLEAMACGCPVVAAARSSLPEVGGDAARYAAAQTADDYAQQLQALLSGALREQLVQAGLRHAATFTWERTFAQTDAIYRS